MYVLWILQDLFSKTQFLDRMHSIVIDTMDHITSLPTIVIAGTPGSGHSSNKEVILLMGYSVQLKLSCTDGFEKASILPGNLAYSKLKLYSSILVW